MSRDNFKGTIPEDRLYDPEWDMWVREKGEEVLIGATSYGIFLAGEIIGFTAKPLGAQVEAGRSLGTVECAKTVLAVHSPVSFVLTEINEAVEANATALNRDPYGTGWMVRGQSVAWNTEKQRLVGASEYREHILSLEPEAEFQ
jgi:glycine cleavage system H protein